MSLPKKLSSDEVAEIRALLKSGWKQRSIARHYEVSQSTISFIKRGYPYREKASIGR